MLPVLLLFTVRLSFTGGADDGEKCITFIILRALLILLILGFYGRAMLSAWLFCSLRWLGTSERDVFFYLIGFHDNLW